MSILQLTDKYTRVEDKTYTDTHVPQCILKAEEEAAVKKAAEQAAAAKKKVCVRV
jgi:hypothetical protein